LGFKEVYDYGPGKVDWMACALPVEGRPEGKALLVDFVRQDVPTCSLKERVPDVRKKAGDANQCIAVNKANVVLGVIDKEALSQNGKKTVEETMDPAPTTFRPNTAVDQVAAFMARNDLTEILVTTSEGNCSELWIVRP
jgi:Mg/Co/Ni transporter MgtE